MVPFPLARVTADMERGEEGGGGGVEQRSSALSVVSAVSGSSDREREREREREVMESNVQSTQHTSTFRMVHNKTLTT